MNNLFLNCNYILYIIHYFIEKIQKEPNKVMELIIKSQDNIKKKNVEFIENNYIEYLKVHREEDEDIPLINNERINQNQNWLNNNNNIEEDESENKENQKNSYYYNEKIEEKIFFR